MVLNQFNPRTPLLVGLFTLATALGAAQHLSAEEPPPLVRSARSGAWSAPGTWEGGKAPAAGSRVLIREGHKVLYDVNSDQAIRAINVAGTLSFAPDKDTRLDVGLIKIQAGEEFSEEGFDCDGHHDNAPDPDKERPALEVGTPGKPVDPGHVALIRLVYFDGLAKDSCPAILCCGGRMDFHGAPLSRTWVKLGATAKKGDSVVTLAEPVTGWKVGDRVIVTSTRHENDGGDAGSKRVSGTEERTVQALDGTRLTLNKALDLDHLGDGLYRGEVANLSRNVIVESADPDKARGHTMYHKDSAGAISYAEFRHLGKEGVLGRYCLHFHLCGDTMRGSSVIGASIWDSGNRWLTIHGTNYLVARDNVGWGSVGHGFFLEDGTEVYNVLDRNLAVGARRGKPLPKQALPFDRNDGAGFWWANSLNTFTRNVAVENGLYGFRFEASASRSFPLVLPIQQPDGSKDKIDVRTLPFVRFEDNEAHSTVGLYGVNLGEGVERVGPDTRHPFVVRNLLIWATHYGFRPQVPSLLVENLHLHDTVYGIYHPNYDNHVYRDVTINGDGSEPFNRGHDDLSVQYGALTVDGLTFEGVRGGPSGIPLIQISDDNPTGKAVSHFRNVKRVDVKDSKRTLVNLGGGPRPTPKTEAGVPVYLHDWYGPGRHARVVSTKAKKELDDGHTYKEDPPLTGDESRVAEVTDVEFPKLLDPVDDLPPTTVITHAVRAGNKVVVRGSTSDNGTVKRVLVNGKEAQPTRPNFAEWEVELDAVPNGSLTLQAYAEDAAGNVEKRPHARAVR
jgi:G8 domain